MAHNALIILAPGFEDLEAVTVIDLLRRAGMNLQIASLTEDEAIGARGTPIRTDTNLSLLNQDLAFDVLVLPGGQPGVDNLCQDERVLAMVRRQIANNRLVAAVCAAPKVLAVADVINGKTITHYPGAISGAQVKSANVTENPVEVDLPIITGRSVGAAMDFALAIIEAVDGAETRHAVEQPMLRS